MAEGTAGRRTAGRRIRSIDRRARRAALTALAIGFITIGFSSAAIAETLSPVCPERPDGAARARDTANTWFKKGEALVKEKLYTEALGAFNCSLRMFEHPATMMNAARAAELAGNKPEALDLYKRAVAATPEAEMATWAQKRVAELEAELGSVGAPEKVPEENPEPAVAPEPGPKPVAEPGSPSKPLEAGGGDAGGSMLIAPGYAAVVVGSVGVVLGTALTGLAAKAKKDGEATHSYAEFKAKQAALAGLQTGAIIGYAVGGAALAAGIVMVIVGRKGAEKPADSSAAVEVGVYPGVGSLALGGTF